MRSIVIHCHFYQPPREDPWLGLIDRERSAAPDHDWNARIARQCYAPLAGLGSLPGDPRANLFASLSFDIGPTLFEWLERYAPETYAAILIADRQSARRFGGHGNAMAMPYNHVILPLASRRDKVTEVRWGIADFSRRYGRAPEGMWLPEAAVDDETLDVLASEGIRFTVLAPHQLENPPEDGLPILHTTASGRSIAVFAYDGGIATDVAFGQLLADPTGEAFAARLAPRRTGARLPDDSVTAVATDGETYGHHHRQGARALAGAAARLRARHHGLKLENFALILARVPARREGRVRPLTSWSCPHGVERWRSGCECRVGPPAPTGQQWRAPLREAMDWLASRLHETFEQEGSALFADPWAARDGYGSVIARDGEALQAYVAAQLRVPDADGATDPARLVRARELLELERSALRMFTSCGWFFDAVTGLETRLILRIAAHAMGLANTEAVRGEFLARLRGRNDSGAPAVSLVPRAAVARVGALVRAAAGISGVRVYAPRLEASRIGWYDVALADAPDGIRLTNWRTGRAHDAVATADADETVRVTVRLAEPVVDAADGETVTLDENELPEREATFVELAREIGLPQSRESRQT